MTWTPLSPTDVEALREELLAHYDRAARDLPWRRDTDPYRVLVSEIMLQQTRVETVTRYYGPWLERFPSIEALATADEDDVLKAWEGLGYYRRARNLHRAAAIVAEAHAGAIPSDPDRLRALPGIGDYTAGAVASIAFGLAEPAVDGNVRRVFARLFDRAQPRPAWLRKRAAELVDPVRPGDWNQALMEFGATVCTPRSPRCGGCPLSSRCAAFEAGTVEERPAPPARRAVPERTIGLAVMLHRGKALLERRPADGLLGGMWAFPEFDPGKPSARHAPSRPFTALARRFGLAVSDGPVALAPVMHRFTHLEARYLPWRSSVDVVDAGPVARSDELRWVGPDERAAVALPVAQGRVFESLHEQEEGR